MVNFVSKNAFWLIFGVLLVHAQDIVFKQDDDEDYMERRFMRPLKIPETVLIQMKDIHNVSEFIKRFLTKNETIDPIVSESLPGINGRNPLFGPPRALPSFAQPAVCEPEEKIIELEKPGLNGVILWPSCVRVKRCGGCCTSKLLTCNPTQTSKLDITVLQVRYNPRVANLFEDEGSRVFSVEQHDHCACGCKVQPADCIPDVQEYRPNECRCVCANQEEALTCLGPKRIWDSNDCMCKCRRMQQCSSGRFYNIQKCKCEVLRNSPVLNEEHEYNSILRNSTLQFHT